MVNLQENVQCYARPVQREVLLGLLENDTIRNNFFLTGGTSLSVFYLHHRTSIDLDLFSTRKVPIDEIYSWAIKRWPGAVRQINQNEFILQALIKDVKVDVVYDPLSFIEERQKYHFSENKFVMVDTLRNMVSNKLCAMIGRREIKDFVDFYFICKRVKSSDFDDIYTDAREKEGMFDDAPTVAYQLETNLSFIRENVDIFPHMLVDFDIDEFFRFYADLVQRIYHRLGQIHR